MALATNSTGLLKFYMHLLHYYFNCYFILQARACVFWVDNIHFFFFGNSFFASFGFIYVVIATLDGNKINARIRYKSVTILGISHLLCLAIKKQWDV
ncbi:hypothetical protein K450DRAFT_250937 [Umbelopsis ramanniana AG]|uniref:Uncharacterized protein n=1 Tax=Umbelopsis ramanniana AG TaxID=1314678 RepID=A0AAD5E690_UMBRA|nr:uncharacterized protein K450DRAFT_250937 [Umbelopsis ramanniana AG]KAI8577627.1 hypothetical protein K450DRAFT_250937 [Umbelopsis ramanniana AG]